MVQGRHVTYYWCSLFESRDGNQDLQLVEHKKIVNGCQNGGKRKKKIVWRQNVSRDVKSEHSWWGLMAMAGGATEGTLPRR
jgi:hypothetical protein